MATIATLQCFHAVQFRQQLIHNSICHSRAVMTTTEIIDDILSQLRANRGARASNSSKKITHGRDDLALHNNSFSLCHTYPHTLTFDLPLTFQKCRVHSVHSRRCTSTAIPGPVHLIYQRKTRAFTLIAFMPHSAATARATSVLPHPEGPWSNTPRPSFTPHDSNRCRY
jgi:hypothetical protein